MSLADRVRAAREQWVNAGGREWLIRRPTDLQLAQLSGKPMSDLVLSTVVGWKLQANEIYPGGEGAVLPFDAEAFQEWVGDHVDIVAELAKAIENIIDQHVKKKQEAKKN
jgi:hypothetical protein